MKNEKDKYEKPKLVHPYVRHLRHDRCAICDRPRDQHSSVYQEPAPPIDEAALSGAQ